MSISVAIEVHPLLDSDWFKIGGSHDVDIVIRAAGFDCNDEVAKIVVTAEGYDPVTVDVITLGEHRVKGLPDTDREGEDVSDDKEYIQKHLKDLDNAGSIHEGCWLSAQISGLDEMDDTIIPDFYVTDSLAEVLKDLPWLLKEAGHAVIGEQLEDAYKTHGANAYLELFTQSNCLIAPDVLGDRFLDSLAEISTPDTSSDMSH